jgi:hypothetical protein
VLVEAEEQLTDLTTVFLGFGFFTLQSSFQFKTGHYDERGQKLLYERRALGYLRPGQLALLLAAQLVLREQGRQELERVLAALSPNHAAALRRGHAELRDEREDLIEALGLPPQSEWPAPVPLAQAARPLARAVVRVADHVALQRERYEEDKIAFRVRGHRGLLGAALGSLLGFLEAEEKYRDAR